MVHLLHMKWVHIMLTLTSMLILHVLLSYRHFKNIWVIFYFGSMPVPRFCSTFYTYSSPQPLHTYSLQDSLFMQKYLITCLGKKLINQKWFYIKYERRLNKWDIYNKRNWIVKILFNRIQINSSNKEFEIQRLLCAERRRMS
jgi:hypothetical protein